MRALCAHDLHKRWPQVQPADIDDAVSMAMVDLLDYWVELPSSVDYGDPERNFNFALRRATWTAVHFLCQGLDDRSHEMSMDEEDEDTHAPLWDIPDDAPGPEEVVMRRHELDIARLFLASLPEDELPKWLDPFLREESVTEQARREGVSHPAIAERRRRGLQRIVDAAKAAGLRS